VWLLSWYSLDGRLGLPTTLWSPVAQIPTPRWAAVDGQRLSCFPWAARGEDQVHAAGKYWSTSNGFFHLSFTREAAGKGL
jgi:hypothetical protein